MEKSRENWSFNAEALKSCPVVAAAWAGSLKHQWCIVAVRFASLFLMDILQAMKGKRAGNASNWHNRSRWTSFEYVYKQNIWW